MGRGKGRKGDRGFVEQGRLEGREGRGSAAWRSRGEEKAREGRRVS